MKRASKAEISLIRKLKRKKYRLALGLFLVEGEKSVTEFLSTGLRLKDVFLEEGLEFSFNHEGKVMDSKSMKEVSSLANPPGVLAVFEIPKQGVFSPQNPSLILDGIVDPGNAGTLIRLADWYGVEQVVALEGTVDFYNPKTIQSSMGSLGRIQVFNGSNSSFLERMNEVLDSVFIADLNGEGPSVLKSEALHLVIGSESHGPSEFWNQTSAKRVFIGRPEGRVTESLNAAVSGGILLEAWKGLGT